MLDKVLYHMVSVTRMTLSSIITLIKYMYPIRPLGTAHDKLTTCLLHEQIFTDCLVLDTDNNFFVRFYSKIKFYLNE